MKEIAAMIRIGYAPGAFDLFPIGHLNLLRRAKERCDFLIAGVVRRRGADPAQGSHSRYSPCRAVEIVRNVRFVDMAHAAMTNDKTEIWRQLGFNLLFKGDDWRGTEKGIRLERDFAALGVEVVYFPYTQATSSSALRRTLHNIDVMATRSITVTPPLELQQAA
jgi:glycerol-3-phosphate cytidylyltransferase